jgi:Uma2 family endonuclease
MGSGKRWNPVTTKRGMVFPISDAEIRELSERNPGYQFECTAEGRLLVTPSGSKGGQRNLEVAGQLRDWNKKKKLGVVFDSSAGFRLPDGSLFAPDASFVRWERWAALTAEQQEGFAPLCPDAVFEVRSPTQSLAELREKMGVYLANGAVIGGFIDPFEKIVEVYRPRREPERHDSPARLSLDPELPDFELDPTPIFYG